MELGVSSNIDEIIAKNRRRGVMFDREQRQAAREIAPVMERTAQRVLRVKVYSVPAVGWRRTGDLIGKEEWKPDGTDVIGQNTSDHAAARRNLGTAGGRRIISAGVQVVDWQKEAVEERRSWILEVRRQHHLRALRQ